MNEMNEVFFYTEKVRKNDGSIEVFEYECKFEVIEGKTYWMLREIGESDFVMAYFEDEVPVEIMVEAQKRGIIKVYGLGD